MNGTGTDDEQAPLPPEFRPAPPVPPQVEATDSPLPPAPQAPVDAATPNNAEQGLLYSRFRSKLLLGTLGGALLLTPLLLLAPQLLQLENSAAPAHVQSAATIRFEQLKPQAAQGNAQACYELALCYQQGTGTPANAQETQRWLQTAAELGLPQAQLALAESAYAEQRYATAAHYYRATLPQLNAEQLYRLARSIEASDTTADARQEALQYYAEASAQGHAEAAYTLGLYYYKGSGVTASPQEAMRLMQVAADTGHTEAQYHLGWMLLQQNTPQTTAQALQYLCDAAQKGHAAACYNAALLLKQHSQSPAEQQQALNYLQCAAEQKHAAALFALSFYYSEGNLVSKNPTQAVRLLEQAAQAGYAPAQYHFAWCLHHGYARHASLSAALPWYVKAAQQHNPDAKAALSKLWCMKIMRGFTIYKVQFTNF